MTLPSHTLGPHAFPDVDPGVVEVAGDGHGSVRAGEQGMMRHVLITDEVVLLETL